MSKLVAKNALILSLVEILGKAIEFFSFVVLARMLGVEKYGILNFVYTISTTFTLLPHFGFDQLVARDIPRQQEKTGVYLIGISIAKIFLFAATLILLWIWLEFFSHFDPAKKTLLYVGLWGVFFLSNIMFTSAFFRAYQRAAIEAGIRITMAIVVMIASIVTVLISTDLFNLLMVRLCVAVGIFLLSIFQIVTMLKPNLRGVLKDVDIASYIQKGWPFAVFIFFTAIYVSIDIVMLSLMAGDTATGFYSVATKIIIFFILVPTGIGNAVMPAMSEKVKSDFDGFLRLAHSATRYLLILSILAVMFNMFLGQTIIHLLFGKEYAKAGLILMLLSWSLVPSYLNHIWNAMLLSFNKEKIIIVFAAIGAASNILLNLFLIPKYTYYGASLATILTEGVVIAVQYLYIKRKILPQMSMFVDNRMIFLMGIGIIFVLVWLFQKWLWVGFIPAVLGYGFLLFKFGYLRKEEFSSFLRYLLKKG